MARRAILVVLSLFTATVLVALDVSPAHATPEAEETAEPGVTVAHTIEDPFEAVETWFPRHGISPAAGITVMRCETGGTFNRFIKSKTGKFLGLFQHWNTKWPGRVAAYNRANDLKTPDADWTNPTTQALVTAWMVKNDGGWGQWDPKCRPSRSRRARR